MSALRCPSCGGPLDTSARKAAAWCRSCGEVTAAGLLIARLTARACAAEAESARLAALLTEAREALEPLCVPAEVCAREGAGHRFAPVCECSQAAARALLARLTPKESEK